MLGRNAITLPIPPIPSLPLARMVTDTEHNLRVIAFLRTTNLSTSTNRLDISFLPHIKYSSCAHPSIVSEDETADDTLSERCWHTR